MKKIFLINFILLALLVFVDRVSKNHALDEGVSIQNHGIFLNILQNAPDTIKIISLATMAGLIFFIFIIALYVLPERLIFLRLMFTFVMSAVMSNTYDKVMKGFTIDFIPFLDMSFNVADLWMFAGVLSIIFFIFKNHNNLWVKENNRRLKLVNPSEQMAIATQYTIVSFCTSVIIGLLSASFLQIYVVPSVLKSAQVLEIFSFLFVTVSVLFCLITFVAGVFLSHKTVGPIHALNRYVDDIIEGKEGTLILREGDRFKLLERIALKIGQSKKADQDS